MDKFVIILAIVLWTTKTQAQGIY